MLARDNYSYKKYQKELAKKKKREEKQQRKRAASAPDSQAGLNEDVSVV